MITQKEYDSIRRRDAVIQRYLIDHKTNRLTPEAAAQLPQVTNEERNQAEIFEFYHNPPSSYFLYVNEAKKAATTFMGGILGVVIFGKEYKDNFGGTRVSIRVQAINGKRYFGTYYKSAGDYARIRTYKEGE